MAADDSTTARWRAQARQAWLQLRGLNPRDPASWPVLPQLVLLACLALGVVAVLWILLLADAGEALDAQVRREQALRADFVRKAGQTTHHEALKRQRLQVQSQLERLERQLPGKAEIDALLSDINHAGHARGLNFDLFRPGQVVVRPYFAELPITVKVTGRYHDLGRFAADIAALPRIVTLHQIAITSGRDGRLTLEALLRTFRALEPEEMQAQRKAAAGGKP